MKNTFRNELIQSMEELTKNGFKCFILKENCSYLYGFIITHNDNIIYIQRGSFKFLGWNTTLKYKPSQKTGNGCGCLDNPFQKITTDIILQSEKEGLQFARKLKANLYKSSEEFFETLWNKEDMIEIKI
jgi:hypothetical protein